MGKKKEIQKEGKNIRGHIPLFSRGIIRGDYWKHLGLLLAMVILLSGCNTAKKLMKECDITPYSLYQGVIMKGEIPVAHLEPLELSLDNGKLVYEAKITIDKPVDAGDAICLIAFIHEVRPKWEVEVEIGKLK